MKQKTGRKLLGFLLTLAMVIGLMPGMGLTAYAAPALDPVSYMAWNGTTLVEKTGDDACTTTPWSLRTPRLLKMARRYVMSNSDRQRARITVTGTVNPILCDGATLTASKGITVNSGNTINIYAQIGGTGELNAGSDLNAWQALAAAPDTKEGTVNIRGGKITATGGSNTFVYRRRDGWRQWGKSTSTMVQSPHEDKTFARGIRRIPKKSGGTVNIYGGTVNASGSTIWYNRYRHRRNESWKLCCAQSDSAVKLQPPARKRQSDRYSGYGNH